MHKMRERQGRVGQGMYMQRTREQPSFLWGLTVQLAIIIITLIIRTHMVLGPKRVLETILSN